MRSSSHACAPRPSNVTETRKRAGMIRSVSMSSPALTPEGKPTPKPHWKLAAEPSRVITSASEMTRERIAQANVLIVVAGMEGALPSVVGGMVSCPVIAVPTSVGYGASFGGLSALLAMLNSCAAGVAVMNIDNGFGAGYFAHLVNK